jgi:hypothetical protein
MGATDRRTFLRQAAAGMGVALGVHCMEAEAGRAALEEGTASAGAGKALRASDVVPLGKTGIRVSRLAMGTGSSGGEQRERGVVGLAKLLRYALDRGIFWIETADLYKTHPHVAAFLKQVQRDKVVITTKTLAKEPAAARDDIERFRKELGLDCIDILLLHCMSQGDWTQALRGCMDVLSEAKQKGKVRAIGASLHNLGALEAAARDAWGDVYLVRVNPFAVDTDARKPEDWPRVEKVLETLRSGGKALYGMKLLGGARYHRDSLLKGEKIDASLRFALTRTYLSGFTIGLSQETDFDDIIRRIDRIGHVPQKGEGS